MNILTMAVAVVMTAGVAFATNSKMEGVDVVCSKDGDFVAFNVKAKRMWMGEDPFQSNAMGAEFEKVEMTEQSVRSAVVVYKDEFKLDFGGGQITTMLMSGTLFRDKIPMETLATITLGGQSQTSTLFCIVNWK